MLSYSLYHLFANTQAGARFADKTRQAIAFAQLRTQRTHIIVYAGGYFEIFETLSFMQLILHLSPPVQEQLRMWLADHLTQVLGFAIGGPAFAHAFSMHLRLLGRGEYHMPPEDPARRQHPVTWLRVRLLAHRARQMGHHTDADALEHVWDTIAEAMGIVEDYYGFYAPEFLPAVQQTLDDMLTETSPRRFTDQEVALATRLSPTASPVHLVNHAWHQFWGLPRAITRGKRMLYRPIWHPKYHLYNVVPGVPHEGITDSIGYLAQIHQGEETMPKIELTDQQILDAVRQLTPQEQHQLEVDLQASQPSLEYPAFTADDPLWNVVGIGKGTGAPVARQHDKYLYQRDC